jgi:hypothetical protein
MSATKNMLAHIANSMTTVSRKLALRIGRLVEARKRRIEQDDQFYRELRAYCRANNLSPVFEDDWRTWADDRKEDIRSSNRPGWQ